MNPTWIDRWAIRLGVATEQERQAQHPDEVNLEAGG
jgi:hypothetical protein